MKLTPLLRPGALATAGLMLASGMGGEARAQAKGREWGADVGVFAAYHFGRGFGAGLEARALYAYPIERCGDGRSTFGGAVARLALVGFDQVRLSLGPTYGRNGIMNEVDLELMSGYRFGREPGFFLQPTLGGSLAIFTARAALALPLEASLALGVRSPSIVTANGCYEIGRPLRRGDGRAPLPEVLAPGCALTSADRAAAIWSQRAAAEWASVPAFWELAAQLALVGAPPSLVARAQAAAADELRHTLVAGSIAVALGDEVISLAPPAVGMRPALPGRAGLVRLATESWLDGCLGEGLAATVAAREAQTAAGTDLRQAQAAIAVDEAEHAALAWDILAWTAAVDRAGTSAAVAPLGAPATGVDGPRDLAAFGCLPPEETTKLAGRHRARTLVRRQALLSA